jgi:hypothetical protein
MNKASELLRPATPKRSRSANAKTVPKAMLAKFIANYADAAAKAERAGRAYTITYRISPDGNLEVVPEVPVEVPSLEAALLRAKARGAAKAKDILEGADMLTAKDFGKLIGVSHETVNTKRKRHEVLGLVGATRRVKYPRWQVTADGLPLPGLTCIFKKLVSPWAVYRFLGAAHAELGGRTALDALIAGDVEAVVGTAANQAAGTFS